MRLMEQIPRVTATLALIAIASGTPPLSGQTFDGAEFHRTLLRADSLYESGERTASVDLYARIVQGDPDHARAWYRLGRAYESLERWDDAADALERAHTIGYRFPWWIAARIAEHRVRLGETDLALQWLEKALADGFEEPAALAEDPAFDALAGDPRFERLLGSVGDRLDRVAGWRHDLRYYVEEALRLHVPPGPARSEAFRALADSIHDRVPELDEAEMILELQRLAVLLGDGHTAIYTSDGNRMGVEFPHLPVLFHRFENGLYVVDGADEGEALTGRRVTGIGGLDPDEVLRRLDPYLYRDNAMTPLWIGVRFYLPSARHLVAVGAAEDPSRVTLQLESPEGAKRDVTLATGDHAFPRKLRHPSTATGPAPLWLREVDVPYRTVVLPELDAVYLPFNQVRDAEKGPPLSAFADTLRQVLEETGASHLIVDVRHNNGGNSGLLRPLVRTLVWWEADRPGRRIWIITSRNTFSAAQSFINQVERWTDAVFVGERSSSSPNFSGEESSLVLPWSGVRGSISSRYFQDSGPLDDRSWIDVDLPVPLTAEDYFTGRDPVLESIAEVIGRSR